MNPQLQPKHDRLFDPPIVRRAIVDSFLKLESAAAAPQPGDVHRVRRQHPDDGAWDSTRLSTAGQESPGFIFGVSAWLWFTVLFANFAEAMAEGRGKAQADSLRATRRDVQAKKLDEPRYGAEPAADVPRRSLRKDDVVLVEAGDLIPSDGEVIEGVASVDESAITGESAPVIRESGGDRSSVTGGTRVLSDWLVVRMTANPGETFLDRMISAGRRRQAAKDAERNRARYSARRDDDHLSGRLRDAAAVLEVQRRGRRPGSPITVTVLVALLVCLIPTTIGGLLSAIGIAGMDRMIQANVIAMSGRAVEAAGDVDVLLLDKTGTITMGNRQAVELIPAAGVEPGASGRRRTAGVAGRRNARRPQHRRAGQGKVRPARPQRARPRARRSFRSPRRRE